MKGKTLQICWEQDKGIFYLNGDSEISYEEARERAKNKVYQSIEFVRSSGVMPVNQFLEANRIKSELEECI